MPVIYDIGCQSNILTYWHHATSGHPVTIYTKIFSFQNIITRRIFYVFNPIILKDHKMSLILNWKLACQFDIFAIRVSLFQLLCYYVATKNKSQVPEWKYSFSTNYVSTNSTIIYMNISWCIVPCMDNRYYMYQHMILCGHMARAQTIMHSALPLIIYIFNYS